MFRRCDEIFVMLKEKLCSCFSFSLFLLAMFFYNRFVVKTESFVYFSLAMYALCTFNNFLIILNLVSYSEVCMEKANVTDQYHAIKRLRTEIIHLLQHQSLFLTKQQSLT